MEQAALFQQQPADKTPALHETYPTDRQTELGQFFTPCWVAEALLEEFFPDLDQNDVVLDPSAGPGHWLQAVPAQVAAYGVELDPQIAEIARQRTGRPIITGDFRTVTVDVRPTAIVGSPPFETDLLDGFLERAHDLLPAGGRVGFILSTHMLQTAGRVSRYNRDWGIRQTLIPRNLYPGLIRPILFAMFSKDRQKMLVGFSLYQETTDLQRLPKELREVLTSGRTSGSVWRLAVERALRGLGGNATTDAIYSAMVEYRPTSTQFWKEKTRQTLQRYFRHLGPSQWALPEAA